MRRGLHIYLLGNNKARIMATWSTAFAHQVALRQLISGRPALSLGTSWLGTTFYEIVLGVAAGSSPALTSTSPRLPMPRKARQK
eukprot:693996-Pleurochrysis_carterae.AAC.2